MATTQQRRDRYRCTWRSVVLTLAIVGICQTGRAQTYEELEAPPFENDRTAVTDGANLEREFQWLKAIDHYETSLKKWPDNAYLQYGLRRSKVHFSIERRYADNSFDRELLQLPRTTALDRFDELLQKVRNGYVDSLSATSFVAHGTESFYLALNNRKYLERNLPRADAARIADLRKTLRERYWNKPVADNFAARQTVIEIADLAERQLGIKGTAVVLEYVFGGCNALDDYSNYLTPDRLNDLYGNIDGEFVGLGIEMKAKVGKGMHLVNVLPESPAEAGGLHAGDYITAVDGKDCRNMTTDETAKLLRGPSGSRVKLEVEDGTTGRVWDNMFSRRAVQVKSIPVAKIIDDRLGVGYIRMTGFQKTTKVELDEALANLQRQGMRSLIWDLRGNPGGLLTAAVEVLDRFIDRGVLVSTKGRTRDQNWSYSARGTDTLTMPLVLLVDGDSASASEIVAGAVRDHHRGTIVGRQTYGKWSVQSIYPLQGSAGLRLTTAKFYAPGGDTLGKIGVKPDVIVDLKDEQITAFRGRQIADLIADQDVSNGLDVLRRQAARP